LQEDKSLQDVKDEVPQTPFIACIGKFTYCILILLSFCVALNELLALLNYKSLTVIDNE
jgi:hypothetical protein